MQLMSLCEEILADNFNSLVRIIDKRFVNFEHRQVIGKRTALKIPE